MLIGPPRSDSHVTGQQRVSNRFIFRSGRDVGDADLRYETWQSRIVSGRRNIAMFPPMIAKTRRVTSQVSIRFLVSNISSFWSDSLEEKFLLKHYLYHFSFFFFFLFFFLQIIICTIFYKTSFNVKTIGWSNFSSSGMKLTKCVDCQESIYRDIQKYLHDPRMKRSWTEG